MSHELLASIDTCPFRTEDDRLAELCQTLSNRLLALRGEKISHKDIEFLLCDPESVRRSRALHITTSCVLYNVDRSAAALLLHKKRREWFYPGGHPDGSWNWLTSAIRECFEETGIHALRVLYGERDVFPLDERACSGDKFGAVLLPKLVVPHPSTDHSHLDFVYALQTDDERICVDPQESLDGQWYPLAPDFDRATRLFQLGEDTWGVLRGMEQVLQSDESALRLSTTRDQYQLGFDDPHPTC